MAKRKHKGKAGGADGSGGRRRKGRKPRRKSEEKKATDAKRRRTPHRFLPRARLGKGGAQGDAEAGRGGGAQSVAEQHPEWRMEKPSPELMQKILDACGIPVDAVQLNLFWQFHLRLRERNRESNLTRIHSFPDVVVKHFVDCAMAGTLTVLPSPLMDLGSGGGFPGIPLKILHPEVRIVLAEGRRLRVEFLEEVRRCLRLTDLHIYGKQVHSGHEEPVGGVVTRAVERAERTLRRVSGCVVRGGRVILMKGPNCDGEMREAERGLGESYRLVEDHRYVLPSTDHKRRLLVYQRLDGPEPGAEIMLAPPSSP
jgi:16S rRNA (guanine(527)-N(7))-methyltransferase RsmG